MGGTWTEVVHRPDFNVSTMLLLTDGNVLALARNGIRTAALAPDATGGYVHGTWTRRKPMHNRRMYFASAVLSDGCVFVAGGEYDGGAADTADIPNCEVYNPVADIWTEIPPPAGWVNVGDAPCVVLPDGRVLLGNLDTNVTVIFDPAHDTFTPAASKDDRSTEETWTLLPDETVLTVECAGHPRAEKYVVAADKWVRVPDVPVPLVQVSSLEIGPAILLPDGRVFVLGATGRTALYTPPAVADSPGVWEVGPTFPIGDKNKPLQAKDAPACLLPNGRVLCTAGNAREGKYYGKPARFFEYDPASNKLEAVDAPPNKGEKHAPFEGRMLLLPTGQVLYSDGTPTVHVYTPVGAPDERWRPEITDWPAHVRPRQSFMLRGRLLNGLSQAVSYGDDAAMATNYPIVQIRTPSGDVHYCRTSDHSTMGVATGLAIHSTHVEVPAGVEEGAGQLSVIANGIASESRPITVGAGPAVKRGPKAKAHL